MNDQSKNQRREKRKKKQRQRKLDRKSRGSSHIAVDTVVGFVAFFGDLGMACDDEQSCVVTGSRKAMESFIRKHNWTLKNYRIEPATSNHILTAMSLGGIYIFDEQAYERFRPPAEVAGLILEDQEFPEVDDSIGITMVRVGPFFPDSDEEF